MAYYGFTPSNERPSLANPRERNALEFICGACRARQPEWQITKGHVTSVEIYPIPSIYPQLKHFPHLHLLRLSGGFQAIPHEVFGITSLKKLDAKRNQIRCLPPEIDRLKELEYVLLSYNEIRALPAEIGRLGKLRGLYLFNNQIRDLPKEIGDLAMLEELSVAGNPLAAFPDCLTRLHRLRYLEIPRGLPLTRSQRDFIQGLADHFLG